MKYTGNLCPGCAQPFSEDDDVVVCPECGTPQHRGCYDKENKCVCSHLHGEDYAWQGITTNESPLPTERKETLPCPNCGCENPKGSPVCKQCGMKFTIFGMNVVDAMHEEEERTANPNRDIPSYNAPFTLGEGEAFEEKADEDAPANAQQVQQLITDVLTGAEGQSTEGDGRINLGGPFPLNDEIDGVRTNTVGNFIGTNAMGYIAKFKKMQNGKKLSFNFAAFFLSPYWFFYRKLYKAGIVVMTVLLAMSIVATPSLLQSLEAYEAFATALTSETLTEAQFTEMYNQLIAASAPMAVYSILTFLFQFICGFIANPIYKKYVIENAGKAERCPSKGTAMAYIVKYGGASLLIAVASYFAQQLIATLISAMM